MKNNIDYKLYLVTDRGILKGRDITVAVEAAIKGGATLVQLREKDITTSDFYKVALKVKEVTSSYGVPLIINDRIDIALAVDAEGIHVGQSDMPCEIVRKIVGKDKIVGVSTSTIEEAKKAEKDGADYIGVGAVFPTISKDDAKSVSIELLKAIKESVTIPVVAIGGISSKNVALLKPANIEGVAVISDILGKDDITLAAKELKELI
ncbi:thiamine phosphate synthase [Clostridium folliculivorans]|uniref:Thiamine-phosphate synthase n=1 Tax=Clostridium folliculivorans TaxID=2886038 RepID=A0A9W5Y676_9CLOT|nr:thiamine phosphate synthase [Clostridium folliculivorans]GKU27471.1 thiamine-phosphate synthase [Clostridium folliculivorans]GKU32321.1 thiamine-phosphate synthase [Clostridium folliculivorans]